VWRYHETVGERTDFASSRRAGEKRKASSPLRSFFDRFRFGAVVALAALSGLIAWLVVDSREDSTSTQEAVALSVQGLDARAAELDQPVYWVGSRRDTIYELSETPEGVFLRYLPGGAEAQDPRPSLSLGTYPMRNAYNFMSERRRGFGTEVFDVPNQGIAVINTSRPTSVYLAYPGSDFQIELFHPNPATARQLAESGRVRPLVKKELSSSQGPEAVTPAQLRARAADGPLYWAGSRRNHTYELTETPDGTTHIRYLPRGVDVGDRRGFLTISTYPLTDAFDVTRRGAEGPESVSIDLPQGGIAVYTRGHATNLHLAFPGEDVQVEVFAPNPNVARRVVTRGQIVPVG
jgi:hypothetical protein